MKHLDQVRLHVNNTCIQTWTCRYHQGYKPTMKRTVLANDKHVIKVDDINPQQDDRKDDSK